MVGFELTRCLCLITIIRMFMQIKKNKTKTSTITFEKWFWCHTHNFLFKSINLCQSVVECKICGFIVVYTFGMHHLHLGWVKVPHLFWILQWFFFSFVWRNVFNFPLMYRNWKNNHFQFHQLSFICGYLWLTFIFHWIMSNRIEIIAFYLIDFAI